MKLSQVVDELMMLFHETEAYLRLQQHPDAADILKEANAHLHNSRKRLGVADKRYIIATVGMGNVGKSTLLNALFGEPLAPAWNGPCTAFPIEFEKGSRGSYAISGKYRGSFQKERAICQSPEEVGTKLDVWTKSHAGDTLLEKVTVAAPVKLLESGIVIADTPGFGAAQLEGDTQSHENALYAYLKGDVSQVFWVVSAERGGIGKREKEFYDNRLKNVCDDIVITHAEGWDDNDKARFVARYQRELESRFLSFYFVAGKQGMEARLARDEALFEQSGVAELERRFCDLANETKREEILARHITGLVQDLAEWLYDYKKDCGGRGVPLRWCPDSWIRWQANVDQSSNLVQNVTEALRKVEVFV